MAINSKMVSVRIMERCPFCIPLPSNGKLHGMTGSSGLLTGGGGGGRGLVL